MRPGQRSVSVSFGGCGPTLRPLPGRILGFPPLPPLPVQRAGRGVRAPHRRVPELQAARRGTKLRQVSFEKNLCSVFLVLYRLSRARCCCFRCEEGYYGDPLSRQPCEPCLCPDIQGSGRFFATSCHHELQSLSLACVCREGHEGTSPRLSRTDLASSCPVTQGQVVTSEQVPLWLFQDQTVTDAALVTMATWRCRALAVSCVSATTTLIWTTKTPVTA